MLMLFVIGLELDPQRLWKLRASVFGGGALQMVVCGGLIGLFCMFLACVAGGGTDWHDAGAFVHGYRHAGNE
ncbi:glutathione-regulated potassium-efflux system protein KefC [Salmonella enterica subsp. enterica]|uniref:Glutathione-regulated potassium-efflux system protein KefC n=1 Tax=Salmonella enterica I TaxID=59201 RepID=A0A379X054_SALET|nr:glutathione-regulated potassium-efflux system protein KefC [Salmonella enterica subsp. enterica]